jgi:glutathione S-transferase
LMGLQQEPGNPVAIAARAAAAAFYDEMERELGDKQYLAGGCSFVDIAFYMAQLFGARMGIPMSGNTPRLIRWRDRMTARPAVATVVQPMLRFLISRGRPIPEDLAFLVTQ